MSRANWKERREALAELAECARWIGKRDDLVRKAAGAGASKTVIAGMIGLDRSTVYAIIGKSGEQASEPQPYVCPQCGPDPNGADVHAEMRHTWPPATSVGEARERLDKHREQASDDSR